MSIPVDCKDCGRRFKNQESYISHIDSKYDCKEYILCDHCNLLFKTYRKLSEHFYNKHKGDKYQDDRFILIREGLNGTPCAFRVLAEHDHKKKKNDNCKDYETMPTHKHNNGAERLVRKNIYGEPRTLRFKALSSL
jgi:hypothetical protein